MDDVKAAVGALFATSDTHSGAPSQRYRQLRARSLALVRLRKHARSLARRLAHARHQFVDVFRVRRIHQRTSAISSRWIISVRPR